MYAWVLALHIISIISWMAGLLSFTAVVCLSRRCGAGLRALGNAQDNGAPSVARDHDAGNDRVVGIRYLARRLNGRAFGNLVSHQVYFDRSFVGKPHGDGEVAQGIRIGSKHAVRAVL